MADMKHIHEFAVKWYDKFRDKKINYIELIDHYMADDCEALGFVMDCGHAFSEKYGKAANDFEALEDNRYSAAWLGNLFPMAIFQSLGIFWRGNFGASEPCVVYDSIVPSGRTGRFSIKAIQRHSAKSTHRFQ